MKKKVSLILLFYILLWMVGCSSIQLGKGEVREDMQDEKETIQSYTADSRIEDVISDSAFGAYGRLIFPIDEGYYRGETLGQLQMTWYSCIWGEGITTTCGSDYAVYRAQ